MKYALQCNEKFLLRCDDAYDEAYRIANRICGLVAGGARYKDIVVVICDYDDTVNIYNEIFSASNIPVNVDVGMKLIEHPLTKHLRDVILNSPWKETEIPPADENIKEELVNILETIRNTIGDQYLSDFEFNNMFCTLAAAAKISDVPHYSDRVLLVSVKEYEPCFVPYLFVAGACDGAFPMITSDTDIITEQDIAKMSIRIEPSASGQNRRARAHAYNILSSAMQQLCVSYSATNIAGERVALSEIIDESFHVPKDETLHSKPYATNRLLSKIGNDEASLDARGTYWASVQEAANLGDMAIPNLEKVPDNIDNGKQLFFPKERASVTQIENFFKCPYYHFLTNGLGLKKREIRRFGANTVGIILHSFAEQFIKTGRTEIIDDILKEYNFLPRYASSAIRNQCKQISKFLTQDIEASTYKPTLLEHKFKKDIEDISVRGIADRIDTAQIDGKTHAMIVDYKSGSNIGPKLQLPLYMGFLDKNFIPDGAYYLNLKNFKKTKISPDEIAPAYEKTCQALGDIKSGKVAPRPLHPTICEYCLAGATCPKRGVIS